MLFRVGSVSGYTIYGWAPNPISLYGIEPYHRTHSTDLNRHPKGHLFAPFRGTDGQVYDLGTMERQSTKGTSSFLPAIELVLPTGLLLPTP